MIIQLYSHMCFIIPSAICFGRIRSFGTALHPFFFFAMKSVCIVSLVAVAAGAQTRVDPIGQVVDLLADLSAKVQKEGEADQKAYEEYFEWYFLLLWGTHKSEHVSCVIYVEVTLCQFFLWCRGAHCRHCDILLRDLQWSFSVLSHRCRASFELTFIMISQTEFIRSCCLIMQGGRPAVPFGHCRIYHDSYSANPLGIACSALPIRSSCSSACIQQRMPASHAYHAVQPGHTEDRQPCQPAMPAGHSGLPNQ